MEIFNDHVILSILGALIFPRVTLLYLGLVPPGSFLPIFGLIFAPRISIAVVVTPELWEQSSFMTVVIWIIVLAIDGVKFAMNLKMFSAMREQIMDQYRQTMINMRGY
jgi:hypothetical protein